MRQPHLCLPLLAFALALLLSGQAGADDPRKSMQEGLQALYVHRLEALKK